MYRSMRVKEHFAVCLSYLLVGFWGVFTLPRFTGDFSKSSIVPYVLQNLLARSKDIIYDALDAEIVADNHKIHQHQH